MLYDELEVKLGRGKVIYVTGDSGAGKSCLLRDISTELDGSETHVAVPQPQLEELPGVALVDQFPDWDLDRITDLLAFVGISEAFIYLRKPRELSDGQRYRFFLARLIYDALKLEEKQAVIIVDEFLAFLDRETAKNIAYQVRRVATKFGLCFVVATTHDDIAHDLQPNTEITMRLALPPEVTVKALAGA